MAKELPYFKFEPNQWENGNIQILSREDKGLFIDLCSMYWSRLGDVPIKLAIQKLCNGNATAFNSLCEENIIEVLDGNIFIKFLSEQLNEFGDISKQNSKNAKDRWEKYRKQKAECERNATVSISECENDAIREEETREEEIKIKNKGNDIFFNQLLISDSWLESTSMQSKFNPTQVKDFLKKYNDMINVQFEVKQNKREYCTHFINWLNKQQPKKLIYDTQEARSDGVRR